MNKDVHEHKVILYPAHGIIELTDNVMGQNVWAQNFVPTQNGATKRNAYQKIIPRSIGSIVHGLKLV
jgi:hypothetical protein